MVIDCDLEQDPAVKKEVATQTESQGSEIDFRENISNPEVFSFRSINSVESLMSDVSAISDSASPKHRVISSPSYSNL